MGKTKDLSALERGMAVGARRISLCQELQRCCVFTTFKQLWEAQHLEMA
jgi:hypothetical protein